MEQAKEALNYSDTEAEPVNYSPQPNSAVELVRCPQFTTSLYEADKPMTADFSKVDSFVIFICFEGKANFTDDTDNAFTLQAGESVLLPATMRYLDIIPEGNFRALETHV
ncbi:MAG: hypothetical protein IKI60_04080 [Alloprevotella sp.]|nr:hypothetical protein [Alloprevotella sp.]